jgi:TRAP-type C4-dicarboxylate transport system permease small subunit
MKLKEKVQTMNLTAGTIALAFFGITMVAGWVVGRIATKAASKPLNLPQNNLVKALPLAAALALSGGVSLGAWQATESILEPVEEEFPAATCSSGTSSPACYSCPSETAK